MPVTSPTTTRRAAHRRVRARHARHTAAPAPVVELIAPVPATVSAQRCGQVQDSALYSCHCGCAFHAAVSTAVSCPACGGSQDW